MMMFLGAELALYLLILTTGGALLRWSSWLSIVLCFLYGLKHRSGQRALVVAGLGCTVVADLFLVMVDPVQRLWGMIAFLCAQILYAWYLHQVRPAAWILICRVCLAVAGTAVCVAVLREKTDLLALISVAYYG